MPLWSNQGDNAANSDLAAVMQYNLATTAANQTLLFGNTRPDTIRTNAVIGQFGVDTNEAQANPSIPHAGWVLRKEGTGLRAGRVTYEVLVAMGSLAGDGSDDTYFPDYTITILTQPSSNSAQTNHNVTFTVVSTSTPSTTLTYKWQQAYAGGTSWADIPNTAATWFNNTSPTLTANVNTANANTIRVVVRATGANTVYSSNSIVTLLP